ncbi:Ferredoxin [[Actinomadura] parvosata subsp. kistnae]|uniref:Sulfite reductase subunit A n=1 Tax=[Actinomadura] parvosata subsp. kistnae TaxID=1909395 RepID=A0A1U9ZZ54_9ACTN|nr:4Fe-4S dicluster domain-containing protein [Nonomuraea sp. ATCC 55076]AQZ63243.1 sulfite reductase subunit A [Nonomuraea sp. ATCC 55076]SPL98923.1 Ferredoxin [Actinomadura parvosata subsp. kistnae]
MEAAVLDTLDPLIGALRERGYAVVGPMVRDGVIRFAELDSAADLPVGRADEQAPGVYRLHERGELVFGFAASPDSVKRWTHPPRSTLFRMRDGVPEPAAVRAPKVALLGVRACDLAALAVQDRVFLGGRHPDEAYRERRAALFLIAVTCAVPGGTCFCASTGTGPRADSGFDLALTELTGPHRFLVEPGGERGAELLAALPSRPAGDADLETARGVGAAAEARMGRHLDLGGVRERLAEGRESPVWNEIASRCLTCANCTMVCPTCFCVTVEDGTSLDDGTAERTERWDSCFTLEFTELGGAPVRSSGAARYRQWLTHKFSTWFDQFGTCGCVGCGRCVTWCPAGIDIIEELERLR